MKQLLDEFPNDLRFVYRNYPLIGTPESPFHDKAALATQAAEAAGKQGMFWEMYDLLYNNQSDWTSLSIGDFQQWLIQQAEKITDLDVNQFATDLISKELIEHAQNDWKNGQSIGITGTPFILFNGNYLNASVAIEPWNMFTMIRLEVVQDRLFTQCPPMSIDPTRQYIATLHTEKGDIVIELYADHAPLAVNNFVFLAQSGWYDGITFHRVNYDLVAQAGDPSGTGYFLPGYLFKNEISSDLKFDGPGVVGMANMTNVPDSNGSQFFITYSAQPTLDGKYTIFGKVIQGMDVVFSLTPRDPSTGYDIPPGDEILSVTIEEK
jgi:cyclophilin family peptidyl-prolyl cis-trans isomerase